MVAVVWACRPRMRSKRHIWSNRVTHSRSRCGRGRGSDPEPPGGRLSLTGLSDEQAAGLSGMYELSFVSPAGLVPHLAKLF